jgi:hypothetical protein
MSDSLAIGSLNSAKYLFLRSLSEPTENSLRIVVQEAIENYSSSRPATWSDNPEVRELLENTTPIESVEGCKTFELSWSRYAAYLVTEELVGSGGKDVDEDYTGNLFRVYSKSHFLDHLARDTGGHLEPIHHFKLICLDHLIDVAAYATPDIRLIDQPSASHRIH